VRLPEADDLRSNEGNKFSDTDARFVETTPIGAGEDSVELGQDAAKATIRHDTITGRDKEKTPE
jgi:hypothetical protein